MPMYNFKCEGCGKRFRKLFPNEKAATSQQLTCRECGAALTRAPAAPTSQITETLDNGVMVRKVERLADAEKIFYDRAHPDKKGAI